MPIRNEAGYIERSVRAVLGQDYPVDRLEVIVVDGMSTDGTIELVQRLIDEARSNGDPRRFVLAANPSRIVPTALNLGLDESSGDVIIRVDGHCAVPNDYVSRCVELLERTGADCVGGRVVTVGETRAARAIAVAQSSRFGVGGVAFRVGRREPGYVETLAFGAYPREVFDRVGRFDEELVRNQDDEFNFRLIQAGGKIWMDPTLQSTYFSRAHLGSLWRQYFQYGFYKVSVIEKRGAVPSIRHLVPALFVVVLTVGATASITTQDVRWVGVVAVPYLVGVVAATLFAARQELGALALLPFAFLTLHLGYGLGFLWGVLVSAGRRLRALTTRRAVSSVGAKDVEDEAS